MTIKTFVGASAISVIALMGAPAVSHADIRYDVTGTFDDGATVSGYFNINVYGYLDGFDLMTTDGSITGYDYMPSTTYLDGGATDLTFNRADPYAYQGALQLGFSGPLAGYGLQALVTGEGGPSWETSWYVSAQDVPPEPVRYLVSGAVIGVPELSTWAMMLAGFVGLGLAAHRRARKGAVALA